LAGSKAAAIMPKQSDCATNGRMESHLIPYSTSLTLI